MRFLLKFCSLPYILLFLYFLFLLFDYFCYPYSKVVIYYNYVSSCYASFICIYLNLISCELVENYQRALSELYDFLNQLSSTAYLYRYLQWYIHEKLQIVLWCFSQCVFS